MMNSIVAQNVCVDIPVLSKRARSLRTIAFSKVRSIGGRMIENATHVPIVRALDNVNFELRDGDRVGLYGPNGSGKTTLIRALADIYAPTSGSIVRIGTLLPMFDINIGFDDESTGLENIVTRCLMNGMSRAEIDARIDEIIEFSGLDEYIELPIRTYSAGMLLRLMFSIATTAVGEIVLMDEWLAVGDAEFRDKANARLRQITKSAGILVIASHDAGLLRSTCNKLIRLERGRLSTFGPIESVLSAA